MLMHCSRERESSVFLHCISQKNQNIVAGFACFFVYTVVGVVVVVCVWIMAPSEAKNGPCHVSCYCCCPEGEAQICSHRVQLHALPFSPLRCVVWCGVCVNAMRKQMQAKKKQCSKPPTFHAPSRCRCDLTRYLPTPAR